MFFASLCHAQTVPVAAPAHRRRAGRRHAVHPARGTVLDPGPLRAFGRALHRQHRALRPRGRAGPGNAQPDAAGRGALRHRAHEPDVDAVSGTGRARHGRPEPRRPHAAPRGERLSPVPERRPCASATAWSCWPCTSTRRRRCSATSRCSSCPTWRAGARGCPSSTQADFVSALGGTPVYTEFAQIMANMKSGNTDCVITGTMSGHTLGLHE
jgi:hypothetical protein